MLAARARVRSARETDDQSIDAARAMARELAEEAVQRQFEQARLKAEAARRRTAAHAVARSMFSRVAKRREQDESAVRSRLGLAAAARPGEEEPRDVTE